MSNATAVSREPRRGRGAAWIAATVVALLVVTFTTRLFMTPHDSSSDIRHAAAAHWTVSDDQVTVERFTTHERCAVAEVLVRMAGAAKTALIATEAKSGTTVVTRERGERFFDTDDPDWAFTCPGSSSDSGD